MRDQYQRHLEDIQDELFSAFDRALETSEISASESGIAESLNAIGTIAISLARISLQTQESHASLRRLEKIQTELDISFQRAVKMSSSERYYSQESRGQSLNAVGTLASAIEAVGFTLKSREPSVA